MVVVVTRDVANRFRGFLTSCMLEIGPGVYTSPQMSSGVMERVWAVLQGWFTEISGGSIVMTWNSPSEPSGQGIRTLGTPPKQIIEHEGLHILWKPPEEKQVEQGSLT